MTADELCARLQAMPPGGVEVLSRRQLKRLFAEEATQKARKEAALALGERCHCDVAFIGADEMFVRFTRRAD